MLESYMATMADDGDAASAAPMPTKVEDVDKFMVLLDQSEDAHLSNQLY